MTTVRPATRADLPAIVALLADDPLGSGRESPAEPLPAAYAAAYDAISASADNELLVAEVGGAVVGCLQLTFIPGLSHTGLLRAEIEGVRVAAHLRGRGIGESLLRHTIEVARRRGAGLLQLTTNKLRTDAQRFYARHGFAASHVGMKLALER